MRRLSIVAALCLLASCTTMQVATPGRALVTGGTYSRGSVFSVALQAAQEAGLVVQSSDQATGYIYATKSTSPLTANQGHLSISINVVEGTNGISVNTRAILGGQLVAYGATKKAVEEFYQAFLGYIPEAQITVDGQPYTLH